MKKALTSLAAIVTLLASSSPANGFLSDVSLCRQSPDGACVYDSGKSRPHYGNNLIGAPDDFYFPWQVYLFPNDDRLYVMTVMNNDTLESIAADLSDVIHQFRKESPTLWSPIMQFDLARQNGLLNSDGTYKSVQQGDVLIYTLPANK